jgi:alpha-tubulin suppressor-like RCC1 family protein
MLSRRISLRNLGFAILATITTGCSHDAAGPGPGPGPGPGAPSSPLNVSNSRLESIATSIGPAASPNVGAMPAMAVVVADANIAYISLQPQSYPTGNTATITNRRSGATVATTMVDGGIDPIPLPANAGDSVSIEIRTTDGITVATVNNAVPSRRPPKIVRSVPGRGKTGVPLNKNIEVVFTEPVTQISLSSSIRLFHGSVEVSGTATILQGVTAAVVFKPAADLAPSTDYELVVTSGVRDLDGDPLDSTVRVAFTTGTSTEGPVASLSLIPNGADLRVGDQFQAIVVARDAAGNELTGHAVAWRADSSAVDVTSTGLVTARHEGYGTIFAAVEGQLAWMNVRVSNALRPVASAIVAFDSGSVAAGGTLQVAAIALDAEGNLLPRRLIQWSTSNAAVATVAASSPPAQTDVSGAWFNGHLAAAPAIYWANVTGVANGVARIVATIEGHSDTVVVTVAPSLPVVGFVLFPDTTTLLLHETAQFIGSSVNSAGGRTSIPVSQIQWESSNPMVASVDANGVVAGAAAGSSIITAHWNNYSASTRLSVVEVTFESVSAGDRHTCAIAAGGTTYCWGDNEFGQAGRPGLMQFSVASTLFYPKPVPVAEGFAFVAITTGGLHSCGLTAAGAAYCWGYNGVGSLGSGNLEDSWRPVPVSGGLTFATIKAGNNHTCGLTTTGTAYCWGWNYWGQLGSSGQGSSAVPLAVSGGITFAELTTAQANTCGLTKDGAAYCWGWNGDGELGVGTFGPSSATPLPVSGGLTFTSIAAVGTHTCGLTRSGSVYCWGTNGDDELGNGIEHGSSAVPVRVASNLNFSAVGAGLSHSCALDAAGTAYCWGQNITGQIGLGNISTDLFATPQRVVGGLTFDRLTVGSSHNCARTTAGVWYCWGDNQNGALGVGVRTTTASGTPLKVLGQP